MDNRLLSRFVRELSRRGHLITAAYFWAVEFQSGTEQPHWHMLVDAKRVPYGDLVEVWSRFRPPHAPALAEPITADNYHGRAPGFGSLQFTRSGSALKASYYATKYLTKYPQDGYPDWVLDRVGRMPRYGHSHKFFPRLTKHDPMCFCEECRNEPVERPRKKPVKKTKEEREAEKSRKEEQAPKKPGRRTYSRRTIRERVEQCDSTCSIVNVQLVQLPDGTVVDGRGKFGGTLNLPYSEACKFLGVSHEDHWQLEVDGPTTTELEDYARSLEEKRHAA